MSCTPMGEVRQASLEDSRIPQVEDGNLASESGPSPALHLGESSSGRIDNGDMDVTGLKSWGQGRICGVRIRAALHQ